MVIHVTVCAIQSRILCHPSINAKNVLDPLHVRLLLLRLKMVNFWNWAFLDCIVRIEVVIAGIDNHTFDQIYPNDIVIRVAQKTRGVHEVKMREVATWVLNGTPLVQAIEATDDDCDLVSRLE